MAKNNYVKFVNSHDGVCDAVQIHGNMKPWKSTAHALNTANMVVCAKAHDLKGHDRWALIAYHGNIQTLYGSEKRHFADKRNRIIGWLPEKIQNAMDALTSYYYSYEFNDTPYGYFPIWNVAYNENTHDYVITVVNDRNDGIVRRVVKQTRDALA